MNAFSLIEQLSILHDPRQSWKVTHKLSDILLLTICAVIAGAEGWEDIADFRHGAPSDDTIASAASC